MALLQTHADESMAKACAIALVHSCQSTCTPGRDVHDVHRRKASTAPLTLATCARMLHVTAVTALCCRCLCCLCSRETNAFGTSTDWYQLADCTVDVASKICVTGSSVSSITRESEPQHFRRSHQPLSIHFSRVLCERLFSFVDDCCICDSLPAG